MIAAKILLLLLTATLLEAGLITSKSASWPEKRVVFKDGQRQSPIDLNSKFVISKDLPTFKFINHDTDSTFVVKNDGHTLKVTKNDSNCRPAIAGGPLRDLYILREIHFHWDTEGNKGSEHAIDGYKYSSEAHAVYFNYKYKNFECALKKPDGLAVVAFFIEEGSRPNKEVESLLMGLREVTKGSGSTGSMEGTSALGWADEVVQQREYYTYPGSLTTPPYSENVVFIIFPYPMSVSKTAIDVLRSSIGENGQLIGKNWRATQPLKKRYIMHTYNLL